MSRQPILHACTIIVLGLLMPLGLHAQDTLQVENSDPPIYLVKTLNGKSFEGPSISRTEEYIILNTTRLGYVKILFDDIALMQRIDVKDARTLSDPKKDLPYQSPSHYLNMPAAFGMKKGDAYYQNTWLIINQAGYAFSDNFSLGAGMIPIIFDGDAEIPVWLIPKVTYPIIADKVEFSVGSINGWALGSSNFGLVYSKISFGGSKAHISAGLGKTYEDSEWTAPLLFTFDGALKVGQKASITAENYALGEYGVYAAGYHQPIGIVVLDFGLVFFEDDTNDLIGLPWVGLTVRSPTKPKK